MSDIKSIVSTAAQPRLALAAVRVALVVGIVLNLINQGAALWGDAPFSVLHFVLNFIVPFCVSSYSAARNQISLLRIQHGTPGGSNFNGA